MAIEGSIVSDVVAAFGGTTKLARAVGVPISTVDSWDKKRRIPDWRWPNIQAAAVEAGVVLPDEATPRAA